jgi:8-oxo-dGTP diphosphatase
VRLESIRQPCANRAAARDSEIPRCNIRHERLTAVCFPSGFLRVYLKASADLREGWGFESLQACQLRLLFKSARDQATPQLMETSSLKRIHVVAGLICRDGHLLACQRCASAQFPLKWEFPGGKLEPAESPSEALRRELKEELGIEAREFSQVYQNEHLYTDGLRVCLHFFKVAKYDGQIKNHVFQQIRWVQPAELAALDFLDGDRPLIAKLIESGSEFL